MKNQNNNHILPKVLLAMLSLSLFACASKPKPAAEIYSNEPVVVADNNYDAPPSMDASNDQTPTVESSGIAAPSEEPTFTEPPVEEMNNVTPPMESTSSDEMAMLDSTAEPAATDSMDTTTTMTDGLSGTPADHFAVQVVASSSVENLNAFATKYGLSNELTAQVTVNDKTWTVLLLGTYPTLEAAKEALTSIQDKVDTSPWIRSVGSLQ